MSNIATVNKGMTGGQAGRITDRFQAKCRKDGAIFSKDTVQTVLDEEMDGLVGEMFEMLRVRVERRAGIITRHVRVNRTRTPQAVLDATGRKQYTDPNVVDAMPRGEGEEADIHFFKPGRYVNDSELEKEYELRGLKPVDPYSLAQVNVDDPSFADIHPNGTHWKNSKGQWCFAAFGRWCGERGVRVSESGNAWIDDWWFAGVRK
ncbi:MAG: hypothetical protein Q8Q22_01240 [bacterium]|nr:hypothetical protein [bacterium]